MSVLTARFDTRIELETLSNTKVDYEVQGSWSSYKYTYATVVAKTQGSGNVFEGAEMFYEVMEFYIRYDSNINSDFRNYRIKHEGEYYRIISKVVHERNKTLKLVTTNYNLE